MAKVQDKELEQKSKLIDMVQEALQQDEQLREKYQMGDKFKFVRDRLQGLLEQLEKESAFGKTTQIKAQGLELEEGELLVYVHLFNAQGALINTWQSMLVPSVFYDHSVNRPIYPEKSHIESFIRAKSNRLQHGYLIVVIPRALVLTAPESKDNLGQPLLKIKEGALQFNKLVAFVHNENEYRVNEEGYLVKKNN